MIWTWFGFEMLYYEGKAYELDGNVSYQIDRFNRLFARSSQALITSERDLINLAFIALFWLTDGVAASNASYMMNI